MTHSPYKILLHYTEY